jgi:hypothetical protein
MLLIQSFLSSKVLLFVKYVQNYHVQCLRFNKYVWSGKQFKFTVHGFGKSWMLCLQKFSLLFTNSIISPQHFGLSVWLWWQVSDPSLPHLVPHLGGIICTLYYQYKTTFHYNNIWWLYIPSSDIMFVSSLFVCLQSSFFDSTK